MTQKGLQRMLLKERTHLFSVQPDLSVALTLLPVGCWDPVGVILIRDDANVPLMCQ